MKAICFNASIPRYAAGLAIGRLIPSFFWSGLSCTYFADVPEPVLPREDWVKIKTRYGGICGTDLSTIHLKTSPYFSPFSSFPLTFGHENVGVVAAVGKEAGDWRVGERVVVDPGLSCEPRGLELCRYCARGETNLCERRTEGSVSAGILIGNCRDTGGSWGPYFVAHRSQLYRVPDSLTDEQAVLIEPFTIGLHAAVQNMPDDNETVLVLGAGVIGLLTLAALRALGSRARILVLARYPFQAQAAKRLGASEVISAAYGADYYAAVASATGARVFQPIIGKRVVVGGVDRTFECVGTSNSMDDALRLTRGGGQVIAVGVPGIAQGVDWTALFIKELDVTASYVCSHAERYQGRTWHAVDLAMHLMEQGRLDLGWIVTHRFRLENYSQALTKLSQRGSHRILKAVFEFPQE